MAGTLAVLLVMTACSVGSGRIAVGKAAPRFQSFDLAGRPVSLDDQRGHPVLINFWAPWCKPCADEFPVLKRALVQHPGWTVLGVLHQDTKAHAMEFLTSHGATWAAVIDPANQIADAYGVTGIPVTVAVDAHGIVRARRFGRLGSTETDSLASALGP